MQFQFSKETTDLKDNDGYLFIPQQEESVSSDLNDEQNEYFEKSSKTFTENLENSVSDKNYNFFELQRSNEILTEKMDNQQDYSMLLSLKNNNNLSS